MRRSSPANAVRFYISRVRSLARAYSFSTSEISACSNGSTSISRSEAPSTGPCRISRAPDKRNGRPPVSADGVEIHMGNAASAIAERVGRLG